VQSAAAQITAAATDSVLRVERRIPPPPNDPNGPAAGMAAFQIKLLLKLELQHYILN
jgi:hypothetical protein